MERVLTVRRGGVVTGGLSTLRVHVKPVTSRTSARRDVIAWLTADRPEALIMPHCPDVGQVDGKDRWDNDRRGDGVCACVCTRALSLGNCVSIDHQLSTCVTYTQLTVSVMSAHNGLSLGHKLTSYVGYTNTYSFICSSKPQQNNERRRKQI